MLKKAGIILLIAVFVVSTRYVSCPVARMQKYLQGS